MLDHTRSRLSVEFGVELRRCAECRSGRCRVIGTSSAIEKTLKPVNTSLAGGAARAGDAAEIVAVQVDEVEDALFVELIGIVELAGDDPPAVRQRVDVACRRTADRRGPTSRLVGSPES